MTVRCSIANRHLRVPYPDLGPETACARWRGWRWAIKSRGGRKKECPFGFLQAARASDSRSTSLCGGGRGEISGKISEEKRREEERTTTNFCGAMKRFKFLPIRRRARSSPWPRVMLVISRLEEFSLRLAGLDTHLSYNEHT